MANTRSNRDTRNAFVQGVQRFVGAPPARAFASGRLSKWLLKSSGGLPIAVRLTDSSSRVRHTARGGLQAVAALLT